MIAAIAGRAAVRLAVRPVGYVGVARVADAGAGGQSAVCVAMGPSICVYNGPVLAWGSGRVFSTGDIFSTATQPQYISVQPQYRPGRTVAS